MELSNCIQPTLDGASLIEVSVQPAASQNGILGIDEWRHRINISIKAPAKDGKANSALISVLAKILNLPKSSLRITSGLSSRQKKIRVEGVSTNELISRLEEML